MYDGAGEPGFYFYNPTTKVVTRYNTDNYAIISSRVLTVVPVPDAVKIPSGFEPSTLMTSDGVLLEGFVNENNVFIAYMKDEDGNVIGVEAEYYDGTTYRIYGDSVIIAAGGYIEDDEAQMIGNIFEFGDKAAKDIMTDRGNIIAVDASLKLKDALDFMLDNV